MSSKDHIVQNEQIDKENKCTESQKNEIKENNTIENDECSDSIIKTMIDNRIVELEQQILNMKKNERDTLLRAKADVENVRKRADQDIEKAHKFALEKFANELLPVIDNLERAIELINPEKTEYNSILKGIELTLKSFLSVMDKYGIKIINDKDIPFNPELHQAVTTIETDNHKPNQIIDVMQKGYILNGRLLRPAMVVVAKQSNNT
uniref:Protein GrpE n=1 Tax=Candidatus Aschnera chinzeii TaxID=1485666 RepID=A0AAT9G3U9_9ENTR|nr:MAG: nucleotide exchange factor GrpE [Candidatus Aschnera chinzeii]